MFIYIVKIASLLGGLLLSAIAVVTMIEHTARCVAGSNDITDLYRKYDYYGLDEIERFNENIREKDI